MDFINGAKRVIVVIKQVNKHGESKIKKECLLSLTGQGAVHRLMTDLAACDFSIDGMSLIETLDGVTVEEVKEKTEASFIVASELFEVK